MTTGMQRINSQGSIPKAQENRRSFTSLPSNFETSYTDKKENQIFLIYREIQSGAVAKSYYITNGLLIYGEIFAHFLIYDFATAPL
jgi:hypothetical protein